MPKHLSYHTNYYSLTTDTFDDDRFKFNFKWGESPPLYSYNWPYDFCSLVELGKIESTVKFGRERLVVTDEVAQELADENKGKGRTTSHPVDDWFREVMADVSYKAHQASERLRFRTSTRLLFFELSQYVLAE